MNTVYPLKLRSAGGGIINVVVECNRPYPGKFEIFIPRFLKFHTYGDIYTTKKC